MRAKDLIDATRRRIALDEMFAQNRLFIRSPLADIASFDAEFITDLKYEDPNVIDVEFRVVEEKKEKLLTNGETTKAL
jgi:hypothetical protein